MTGWQQQQPRLTAQQRAWIAQPQQLKTLEDFPCDRSVEPVANAGGRQRGLHLLHDFLDHGLGQYSERSDVSQDIASSLSPYLHWGQISVWDMLFGALATESAWNIDALATNKQGSRLGFWPVSEATQLFFDELISWRELSYSSAWLEKDFTLYSSLPSWAQETLAEHAEDPRPYSYSLEQLAAGETHDEHWNAAQRQLRETGLIHNYMRMIWGKNVMLWQQPEQAWDTLVELNNRYALDGRNPNSWSGIGWVFGRYDHPWQERPVIGTVRAMGIAAAKRHGDVKAYLARWGSDVEAGDLFNV